MNTNKSYLMVSGDKENHLDKIKELKASIFMVNLEDGVFNKEYARNLIYTKVMDSQYKSKIVVRINSLDTFGKEDIKIVNKIKPYAIRIPKINNINDVKEALTLIDDDIEIHLSIETAEAFNNLVDFGKIDKRVTTVYLGLLDLLESLKLPQYLLQLENPSIDYILSKFLIDSKLANLNPISFIYQDYKNLDAFKLWCYKVKNIGFSSKACISLEQVDIVNKIFNIDEFELEKAKYIVKIFEENQKNQISGFKDDKYGFIDEPIYKNAKLILNNI